MTVRLKGLDVVVVDDIERMRAYHRAALEASGAGRIREAADGGEAFRIVREDPPDIVVTDYGMEPEDGVELLLKIRDRNLSPNPYLPVVMVTAYTERSRIRKARDAGVNAVLHKPVSPQQLWNSVAEAMNDPRPFIETRNYFGPDRRAVRAAYDGPERRAPG
jgi:CheY-like chemotaxis protein